MDNSGDLGATIVKLENGFLVSVSYPAHMLGLPPGVEAFTRAVKQIGENPSGTADPSAVFGSIMNSLTQKRLRKPVEGYVFASLESAMDFLKELFSGS